MAEPVDQRKAPAAGPTERPWAAVILVLVAAAFVSGWRTGRRWGRFLGY